jgi:hypothetical protein
LSEAIQRQYNLSNATLLNRTVSEFILFWRCTFGENVIIYTSTVQKNSLKKRSHYKI